jgi:hypothetical protein
LQVAEYCWVPRAWRVEVEGATVTLSRYGVAAPVVMVIFPLPEALKESTPAVSVVAEAGAPAPEMV